ncbi:XdhC family protein [Gordonia desulfuricans]|uniref:XdhC family protein n=1 Tax=Gordonia desulfuricans TaxID=89051 RepID=A0A7K3LIS5_9ACTN|nr:XdhC family protein [Gordonia desulfuricans]
MARIIGLRGSAPRDPGATMIIFDDGEVTGNLTGGCVEADIVGHAEELFAERESGTRSATHRVLTYGVTDEWALGVGLLCGGTVEVLVELLDAQQVPHLVALIDEIEAGRTAHLVSAEDEGVLVHAVTDHEGILIAGPRIELPAGAIDDMMSADRGPAGVELSSLVVGDAVEGSLHGRVMLHRFGSRRSRAILAGANDYAAAVSSVALLIGFEPVICDHRPAFARPELFPDVEVRGGSAAEFIRGHARRDDIVIVLTHDAAIDVPVLMAALDADVAYIGALGSRRTHDDRCRRLIEAGVGRIPLDRIHSPIGLDIGARTPEQSAVSIMAEVLASSTGRSGVALTHTSGSIRPAACVRPRVATRD